MKVIKCLSEKIEEELTDANSYIDIAMEWRDQEPETADLFYELSMEEMGHMDRLHNEVVRQINAYKERSGEPPENMMTLYQYLHEKHIGEEMKIKIKQGMYKA